MPRILIGTASWTDKSLIGSGRFYPHGCHSPEDRLRYYASQFPIVEVDSSYYAMPDPRVAQLWSDRTPADFTFNIKAFRLFTGHQTAPSVLPKNIVEAMGPIGKRNIYYKDMPVELLTEMWRLYRAGIEPLKHAGKLGAVHFQFAPWVAYHPKNLEHIEECQRQLEGFRLSIEFRNRTWFEGEHATGDARLRARARLGQRRRRRAAGCDELHSLGMGSNQPRIGDRSAARPQSRDLESEGSVVIGAAIQLRLHR